MSIQKVEMTVERIENGQYVEQVVYPFVEYDHVAMENGMDIMSMIRDDVSTPMVTHNTTSWKVGQGDSDVSEAIVDSSVANMTIKGQTYQNVLPDPTLRNSMTDGKTMQKLNEGYESVNTVDGVCKSAILKGQTLVNLLNDDNIEQRQASNSSSICGYDKETRTFHFITNLSHPFDYSYISTYGLDKKGVVKYFKNDTDYTIMWYGEKIRDDDDSQTVIRIGASENAYGNPGTYLKDANIKTGKMLYRTQTSYADSVFHPLGIKIFNTNNDIEYKLRFVILEGDYTNQDIPYFTGMQSVKMPVLTTTGKNLLKDDLWESGAININTGINVTSVNHSRYNDFIPINTGDVFSFSSSTNAWRKYFLYDSNKNFLQTFPAVSTKKLTISIENTQAKYMRIWIQQNFSSLDSDIQLEQGITATTYEPYKSNILTVNEPVELRGIGEVQDTLDCLTGEVVERVGEYQITGEENWQFESANRRLAVKPTFIPSIKCGRFVCDKLEAKQGNDSSLHGTNGTYYIGYTSDGWIRVILGEDLSSLEQGIEWLKANKPTIQYQLATESIKTVDLSILNQDNQPVTQLNSFANGYIQVSSQEGTLIPTTEYEVPTSNSYHVDLMKPNTQYTMKNMQGTFTIDGIQYNASANGTFTSPSTLSNRLMITNVAQTQPMLLEGDMTSKEVPYVEGNKSAFEGADKVEIVSQNADNTLSNTTSFQLSNPLRSLPNSVRDEIVLDRVNHKAKIIQRVGEDLTQLATPIVTEVNLEGYPYVYKGGHIFLNTEIAPITEVTYSINQAHQIESSNEDILRHQKEINYLYELIAQYVQVQYETELIDIALQG